MQRLSPKRILIAKKAVDSEIAKNVQLAHPEAEITEIQFNTHAFNGKQHSLEPTDIYREKRELLAVLARNATWHPDANGRSTDFLYNVKLGTGCGYFCEYCYVNRNNPNSFPKVYSDVPHAMIQMTEHVMNNIPQYETYFRSRCKKPFEKDRDPEHPNAITFDIGCDSDCLLDNTATRHNNYPGHVIELMNKVATISVQDNLRPMTSFATKGDNVDPFILDCNYPERHRIRLSLMPETHRRILEMNTATIEQRLEAINKLVNAGFEVHINLSPIVVTKRFYREYINLLKFIDHSLTQKAKTQLAYEIIFLTHSELLFDRTAERRPQAHLMMVDGPLPLVPKPNKPKVLSYQRSTKTKLKKWLAKAISKITPYARIRYAF